ncbi:MAG: hypothetical protein LBQ66_07265 [Planctomycetaceae bacterium]|nr:hypothetical protein [Planctomycetaceae bacterium]
MANVLQHVLAFLPNSSGFLMHRGGRDARVPVLRRFAEIVGCTDVFGLLVLAMRVPLHWGEGKPHPYNARSFMMIEFFGLSSHGDAEIYAVCC